VTQISNKITLSHGFGDNRNSATIYIGDCIESLKSMPEKSVHTCVTSPPYWGLRDYGHDGQIGLEDTPEDYVAKIVEVFREVRRVLRDDGTLWLNLGDSYASNWGMGAKRKSSWWSTRSEDLEGKGWGTVETAIPPNSFKPGRPDRLKVKDLVGIPWRVAFALQADGWYLRQDIIWHKPNPMPESVTDRCTKAHEYIFLLAKSARYYYDAEAVKESASSAPTKPRDKSSEGWHDGCGTNNCQTGERIWGDTGTRNRRSVWTVTTKSYKGAHFATFPEELIEPMILAGSSNDGLVLDPFSGSGTTGAVALRLGRNFVGCELNPEYVKLAESRIRGESPPVSSGESEESSESVFDLFGDS